MIVLIVILTLLGIFDAVHIIVFAPSLPVGQLILSLLFSASFVSFTFFILTKVSWLNAHEGLHDDHLANTFGIATAATLVVFFTVAIVFHQGIIWR